MTNPADTPAQLQEEQLQRVEQRQAERAAHPDPRIPYGARCTWWDSIYKVGLTPAVPGKPRLPCCPGCGGMLFEVDSEETWFAGIDRYEAAGHPGYRAMMEWGRGQCFRTMTDLQYAYLFRPRSSYPVEHIVPQRSAPTKRQRRRDRGRRS